MNLLDRLTVEQRSLIDNYEFKAIAENAKLALMTNTSQYSMRVSEALTVWNIFSPKPFCVSEFYDLFCLKEIMEDEILTAIVKERLYSGFTEYRSVEIESKNYFIDMSYHIVVTEDETSSELVSFEVFNKEGDIINTDHISSEEIEKRLLF